MTEIPLFSGCHGLPNEVGVFFSGNVTSYFLDSNRRFFNLSFIVLNIIQTLKCLSRWLYNSQKDDVN